MGRYVNYDDILNRYPAMSKVGGATEVGSAYVDYVESEIDGLLASHYTVPFSGGNVTVRDMCIDLIYARAGNLKVEESEKIEKRVMDRIARLKSGDEVLMTNSGDIIAPSTTGGAWSSTQNYVPTFGMSPIELSEVDSSRIWDEENDRGNV